MFTKSGSTRIFHVHALIGCSKIHDSPFLELGLKGIAREGQSTGRRDRPDRDRLAIRFQSDSRTRHPVDLDRA
jgi:hypothetical protein